LASINTLFIGVASALAGDQGCGKLDEAQFKNGELITQPNEHPWIGRVEETTSDGARRFVCPAVLIDARHALATAHCVHSPSLDITHLVFGTTNYKVVEPATQKNFTIKGIKLHPAYKLGETNNDLAIIALKEAVLFSDFIQPICLPSADDKASGDLIIAGYERPNSQDKSRDPNSKRIKMTFEAIAGEECHKQEEQFPADLFCGSTDLLPLSGSALVQAAGSPKKFHLLGLAVDGFYAKEWKKFVHGYVSIPSKLDWVLKNSGA
ncbi:hypothetical protein KR018_001514, partial [Drosophila ironensis]